MKRCLSGDILVSWDVLVEERLSSGFLSVEECFRREILFMEEFLIIVTLSVEKCLSCGRLRRGMSRL